ncbi:hypothetical protein DA89_2931 [Vibrio paracholerae]|nr:hypothetical protein DA89_2931 [Vibrio paracholerae]
MRFNHLHSLTLHHENQSDAYDPMQLLNSCRNHGYSKSEKTGKDTGRKKPQRVREMKGTLLDSLLPTLLHYNN